MQDAIAVAAKMLHNVEQAGKKVTPGNIAFYTLQHMKSGRRSNGYSRADVMACGTQLDHKSSLLSLAEEVGYDPELDEAIRREDLLACRNEDPSTAAARDLDWEEFLGTHDPRCTVLVTGITAGTRLKETPPESGEGYSRISQLRRKLADDLREYMGEEAIANAVRQPNWRGNLKVSSERAACQADRRR